MNGIEDMMYKYQHYTVQVSELSLTKIGSPVYLSDHDETIRGWVHKIYGECVDIVLFEANTGQLPITIIHIHSEELSDENVHTMLVDMLSRIEVDDLKEFWKDVLR